MKHILAMANSNKHFQKLRHLQHQAMQHIRRLKGIQNKISHVEGGAAQKRGGGKHALKFKM